MPPDKLEELAASIREQGIIQPLVVTRKDDYYEIIAGERRWRAAQKAGLHEIPVVIREATPDAVYGAGADREYPAPGPERH